MDAHHLAKFAQLISSCDRVVGSMYTHYGPRKQMQVSLAGQSAKRVIQAVSSAECGRPPAGMAWANTYLVKAAFFEGTNFLGEIEIDGGELFRAGGREYRDVSFQHGNASSDVLRELVCAPVQKLVHEAEEKEFGSK